VKLPARFTVDMAAPVCYLEDKPMTEILIDLGRIAYEGYCLQADGHSLVSGKALPTWEKQSPEIRASWRAAADAVFMWLELHPKTTRIEDKTE